MRRRASAADYAELGGVATKDLLGGARIRGKFLDIGCIEKPNAGLLILMK